MKDLFGNEITDELDKPTPAQGKEGAHGKATEQGVARGSCHEQGEVIASNGGQDCSVREKEVGCKSEANWGSSLLQERRILWRGRVPSEEKAQKVENWACLLRPRPYTLVRQSKTTIWILNT